MKYFFCFSLLVNFLYGSAQLFEGIITNSQDNSPMEGVKVSLLEDQVNTLTNASGEFSLTAVNNNAKTLVVEYNGYMIEQLYKQTPQSGLVIQLRQKVASAASLRQTTYNSTGCSVTAPNNPDWNVSFRQSNLTGDLAPDNFYTRRDPSSVIEVEGTYYVWYSYSETIDATKLAPWDRNDIYYATSTDGFEWTEQGAAVVRGNSGYDARSVFTTEIFVNNGTYYLVYQAAADADGIYNRNVVGMSYASSPNGPWTKLAEPVLYPSYTNSLLFDNNAVHDPCIIAFNSKYYLFYKGECNCMGAGGCSRWCNPSCGLQKQVKWGVAIADSPTGPYVKSEYNPITNTGHEVSVWNYNGGVAILQHQDGPEAMTIQYAEDGVNFEIMGSITNFPEAPGLFRPNTPSSLPIDGVKWGLCHVLNWNYGPQGWMNLRRFDLVAEEPVISFVKIEAEDFTNTGGTFNDASSGGPGYGVRDAGTAISYVNSQDWVEYDLEITDPGVYKIQYAISTPSDNAEVSAYIDGELLSTDEVNNNGSWGSYETLTSLRSLSLQAGTYTLRIVASGTNDWQWNMDYIRLIKIAEPGGESALVQSEDMVPGIKVYPNPASEQVTIRGIPDVDYNLHVFNVQGVEVKNILMKQHSIKSFDISELPSGVYTLLLIGDQNRQVSRFTKM